MSNHIPSKIKLRTLTKNNSRNELKPLNQASQVRTHIRIRSDFPSASNLRTEKKQSKQLMNPIFKRPVVTTRETTKKKIINENLQFCSWKLKSLAFPEISPIVNKEIKLGSGLADASFNDSLLDLVQVIKVKSRKTLASLIDDC